MTATDSSDKRDLVDDAIDDSRRKKARTDSSDTLQENQVSDLKQEGMQQNASFQRYLVTVEYIGTRFLGWQKQQQQECRTVQGVLEEAFFKFVGKPVQSAGSSRTDTGVHALRNACHVDVERISKRRPGEILPPHEPEVVKRAVNHFLQRDAGDMQVVDVRGVPSNFHARFEAKERTYHYRILAGSEVPSIFEKDRAWHVREDLDILAMQQACQVLVGHHDFSSFRAAGCQANSPFRTLDELHVCEMPAWPCFPSQMERGCFPLGSSSDQKYGRPISSSSMTAEAKCSRADVEDPERDAKVACFVDQPFLETVKPMEESGKTKDSVSRKIKNGGKTCCYVVTARARSFLYHQVRLMVGLLKAVGSGALTNGDVHRILEARTVTQTPPMAPACGLYLANVKYEFDDTNTMDGGHELVSLTREL